MRRIISLSFVTLLAALTARGQVAPNSINTIAGGAAQPSAASSAYLPQPASVVRDSAGNTYITVPSLNAVYMVNSGGTLSIYAGTGLAGFSGDGGPATQAQLDYPLGLAIDGGNNLFITDSKNNRIRRVDARTGAITTVAGSEDPLFGLYAGDGGAATAARLSSPTDVAVDGNGNLFIADNGNAVVRRVDAATQTISTYAGANAPGTGTPGCGSGAATNAIFSNLVGVAVDKTGNLFVSDTKLDIVCEIDTNQNISLYAGTLGNPGTSGAPNGDGGAATAAQIDRPTGLATDAAGNLFITDSGNPAIRKVDTSANHIITTIAGLGTICSNAAEPACGDGLPALRGFLDFPNGVFVDANNNVLIADTFNMRVRQINAANGTIANLAGGGSGGDSGAATSAILGLAQSLALDANENVYALETSGERVRKIDLNGNISTVAGIGFGGQSRNCAQPGCNGDGGPANAARFVEPESIATDAQGNFYIVDSKAAVVGVVNNQANPITVAGVQIAAGSIATIAGNGSACTPGTASYPTCGDGGSATGASLDLPAGIAVDNATGNIYVSDKGLHTVRQITSTGTIVTFAGTPGQACTTYPRNCGDGGLPTSALLNTPLGLAVSPRINRGVPQAGATDVFIADSGDNSVRKVIISVGATVVESMSRAVFDGTATFGGDGASRVAPTAVAVDNLENLFVSGGPDNVVQRLDAFTNRVSTVAGDVQNLNGGFSGDGGPSTQAMIENSGIAVFNTAQGTHDIFIADSGSNRVRKVNLVPVAGIFPGTGSTIPFPITLDGQRNISAISISNQAGLDDLIISNVVVTDPTNSFTAGPSCPAAGLVSIVVPGNACLIDVTFAPGANANGVINATLTFNTNDPALPSLTYTLTGTATPVSFPLTVTLTPPAGSGAPGGFVQSSPFAIDCFSQFTGGTCSANFASGITVDLFTTPSSGFTFSGWGGACSGTGSCSVAMNQAQNVTATFVAGPPPPTPPPMTVNIAGFGSGTGTISDGATLNCTITNGVTSGTCSAQYPTNGQTTSVTLTATAGASTSFVGWLGQSCSQNTCSVFLSPGGNLTLGGVFTGPLQPFSNGQIFLSTNFGMVFVIDPATGNTVQVLSAGVNASDGAGLTFDRSGNLYLASPFASQVEQFAANGTGPALFGTGYQGPWSLVSEPAGTLLVAEPGFSGEGTIVPRFLRFQAGANSTMGPTTTFFPGYTFADFTGISWIELLDSGDTVAYADGSPFIHIFDLAELVQHADLQTQNSAYALRELPDDTLLVANTDRIVRIDQHGNLLLTYTLPAESFVTNLNLDPDGQSFWTNDEFTGTLYRVNIQTGSIMNGNGYSTGLGTSGPRGVFTNGIGGIAVFNQAQSGGADLAVTMSAPSAVNVGSNVTYSLSASNAGPLNATGVTLTASIPNSSVVSLTPNTCTSSTTTQGTTISCPIGSLAVNATASATFTMLPNSPGVITATANISGRESDPNLANNTATATTATGPACTISANPNPVPADLPTTATSTCTDAAGTISTTTINFGDGSAPVNAASAQHAYATPGTYTVTVNAIDNLQLTGSASQTVTVTANQPPTCTLSVAPSLGTAPLTVTANGSCTDPENDIVSTTLDFGDGTVVQDATSGSHTYNTAGTFTVRVTATDAANNTASATKVVTVGIKQALSCTLNVTPNTGVAPLNVTATGNCTDPNGANAINSTSIDFGDGTVVNGTTSGAHTYASAGTFTVKVSAGDIFGNSGSATQNVTVGSSVGPACTLSAAPLSGSIPLLVTFTGNCTGPNSISTTALSFGDGSSVATSSATHTYSQAGTYTATLTATDAFGLSGSATQTITASGNGFPPGIYVAVSSGKVLQFANDGTLLKTFDSTLGGTTSGMAFDKSGNLYSTAFTAGQVTEFNTTTGAKIGSFGSGYSCQPETIVFDGAGDAYVGQSGCSRQILKFDPSGKLLANYTVTTEEQGSDDIDLSADQCTLLYTSEGASILRYDVCHNQQLAPFATGLKKALTLRILPDGGVIVADLQDILRLNAQGQVVTTYTAPNQSCLYGVALDQSGTSFWASDYCSSTVFHFDLTSGKILSQFNAGTPSGTVFGLAISGSGLNVAGVGSGGSATASPQTASLAAGQSATFTVSFTPNAAAAGLTFTLSCANLPPGVTCSFNPSSIKLGAAGTTTTATMTISRTTTAALMNPASPWVLATFTGLIPAVVLVGFGMPRKRRTPLVLLALLVAGMGIWTSCGGGSSSFGGNSTQQQQATPAGTYSVIVVAQGTGVQTSTTVNVTIQ
ncbi:MAG: PKD domain-containing protein [Acidobacteria bacterium]|nr:PKD domain-containing protein [Acidobacteriota bacterium]